MQKLTFENIIREISPTAAPDITEEKYGSQFAKNEQNISETDQYMS